MNVFSRSLILYFMTLIKNDSLVKRVEKHITLIKACFFPSYKNNEHNLLC